MRAARLPQRRTRHRRPGADHRTLSVRPAAGGVRPRGGEDRQSGEQTESASCQRVESEFTDGGEGGARAEEFSGGIGGGDIVGFGGGVVEGGFVVAGFFKTQEKYSGDDFFDDEVSLIPNSCVRNVCLKTTLLCV